MDAGLELRTLADGTELPWVIANDDPARAGEQALFVVGTAQRDVVFVERGDSGGMAVRLGHDAYVDGLDVSPDGRVYTLSDTWPTTNKQHSLEDIRLQQRLALA